MEWLRYEMEGLNHWRIDEKYDDDDPADGIDADDPFRIQRYYVNGPGQLGQIVKAAVYDYSGEEPVSTDYYYGYDVLGNVSVISDTDGAEADQFEQDAFGNQAENSWTNPIAGITEHLTTKQFDTDLGPNGLYYFNARWYDPVIGAFISSVGWSRCVPMTERPYSFASNTPMNNADPSGLWDVKVGPYIIRIRDADPDPHPSRPHGHIEDGPNKGCKVDKCGNIYDKNGNIVGKLKDKEVKEVINQAKKQGVFRRLNRPPCNIYGRIGAAARLTGKIAKPLMVVFFIYNVADQGLAQGTLQTGKDLVFWDEIKAGWNWVNTHEITVEKCNSCEGYDNGDATEYDDHYFEDPPHDHPPSY